MSEDEYQYQQEYEDKMEIFEYGVTHSESLTEVVNEIINDRLNDYYHEKVKPLELQLKKLGVPPDTQERKEDGLYFTLNEIRYNPKDPFRESQKKGNLYSFDSNSDYYRFFEMLFEECLQQQWITIIGGATYDDTKYYWMWLFGCEEKYRTVIRIEDEKEDVVGTDATPLLLLEWQGTKGLCIYLMHVLMKNGYITQNNKNEVIKAHFLPNSSTTSIATQRNKYTHKRDESKQYPKGHKTVLEIIDTCMAKTDE